MSAVRVAVAALVAVLSLSACGPMHRDIPMQTWECPNEPSGYCHG